MGSNIQNTPAERASRTTTTRGRLCATTALTGIALATAPVAAQEAPVAAVARIEIAQAGASREFSIPAQPLASALDRFSEQTGLSFAYRTGELEGVRSPGVSGTLTPREALARLLAGTGVSFTFTDEDTVTLARPGAQGGEGPLQLGPITVEAEGEALPGEGYRINDVGPTLRTDVDPQKVPASVGAVTAETIEDRNLLDTADALETIPGVSRSVFNRTRVEFSIRGDSRNAQKTLNGLRSSPQSDFDPALIDSFQVLRGPSALLAGDAKPGGQVNQIIAVARPGTWADFKVQGGRFEFFRGVADVNGPLPLSLGDSSIDARLIVAAQTKDSPIDEEFMDRFAVAPSLRLQVPGGEVRATGWVQRENGSRSQGIPLLADGSTPEVPDEVGIFGPGTSFEREDNGLLLSWDQSFLKNLKLKTNFLYQDTEVNTALSYAYDFDGAELDGTTNVINSVIDEPSETISGEAALAFTPEIWGQEQEFRIGFSRSIRDSSFAFGYTYAYDAANLFVPSKNVPVDFDQPLFTDRSREETQTGGFAQAIVQPTENFLLFGAVKIDQFSVEEFDRTGRFAPIDITETADTYRVGASYDMTDQITGFASYATGFQVQPFGRDVTGETLPPETSQSIEAGFKTRWFDDQFAANLTFFQTKRQNVGRFNPAFGASETVGETRFRGVELDFAGRIGWGFSAVGGLALIDAEITEDPDPDRLASRPFQAPTYDASLWLRYDQEHGPLAGAYAGIGLVAISDRYLDDVEGVKIDGHERVDVSLGYRPDDRQEFRLFVRNLLNDYYIETPGFPGGYNFPVRPITVTASYNLRF